MTATRQSPAAGDWVETPTRISVPVAVTLERHVDPAKKWGYPEWRVHAVLAGDNLARSAGESVIDVDEHTRRSVHTGFTLDLYRDGSEGYWYNLLSEIPYLFVVCDGEQGAMDIRPLLVTANQDEVNGYLESDGHVLSAPMPAEITALLERYVISHYQPEIRRKRKRRDWLEDSQYVNPPDTGDAGQGG